MLYPTAVGIVLHKISNTGARLVELFPFDEIDAAFVYAIGPADREPLRAGLASWKLKDHEGDEDDKREPRCGA